MQFVIFWPLQLTLFVGLAEHDNFRKLISCEGLEMSDRGGESCSREGSIGVLEACLDNGHVAIRSRLTAFAIRSFVL